MSKPCSKITGYLAKGMAVKNVGSQCQIAVLLVDSALFALGTKMAKHAVQETFQGFFCYVGI